MPSHLQTLMDRMRSVDLRVWAMLISALFLLFTAYRDPLLNSDAFDYLRAVELYGESGALATLNEYGWHGYSLLIALVNGVFPGDALAAARMINILCYALLVYSFISVTLEYRHSEAVKGFAALTILSFPAIGEILEYLIRDFGFWAFTLLALLQLIRYHKAQQLRHGLYFCLAMAAAIFFRLEGLVLLAIAPFSLLFNGELTLSRRFSAIGWLALNLLLLATLITGIALLAGIELLDLFTYSYRNYLPRILDYGTVLGSTADALNEVLYREEFFPGHSFSGMLILIFAYLYTVILNIVDGLTLFIVGVLVYGLHARAYRCSSAALAPVITFFVASFLYLFIFISTMRFSTERYGTLAALLVLTFLPLCLEHLYLKAMAQQRMRLFRWTFGFFLVFFLVDSLISFGYSKQYIPEASAWLRDNAPNTALTTNNHTLAYRSGLVPDYDSTDRDPRTYLEDLPESGILALEIKHDELDLIDRLEADGRLELLARFANSRDDQIRIYRAGPEPDND